MFNRPLPKRIRSTGGMSLSNLCLGRKLTLALRCKNKFGKLMRTVKTLE